MIDAARGIVTLLIMLMLLLWIASMESGCAVPFNAHHRARWTPRDPGTDVDTDCAITHFRSVSPSCPLESEAQEAAASACLAEQIPGPLCSSERASVLVDCTADDARISGSIYCPAAFVIEAGRMRVCAVVTAPRRAQMIECLAPEQDSI